MTTIYIINKENNAEYNIGTNLIGAIKQMVADQRKVTVEEIEIVLTDTEDEIAKTEKRLLNMAQVKQAAYVYGLESEITAPKTPVVTETSETPVTVETPEEKPEKTKENIKMDKTLKNAITAGVKEVNEKFASALETAIADYNTAKETVKKVREEETVKVDAAKTAYEATVKGTIERYMASAILNTAKKAKAEAVSNVIADRAMKKATVDNLKRQLAQKLEEVICGVIQGFDVKPVTETGTVEEPVDDKPVKKPTEETVAEEVENTNSGTGTSTENNSDDKKPVDANEESSDDLAETVKDKVKKTGPDTDAPIDNVPNAESIVTANKTAVDKEVANTDFGQFPNNVPASLPTKTFAVLSFGNVGNKVEAFRTLASKYAWKEVQDWKQADLIRVYTQEGATITSKESAELKAILQAKEATPDRVHFDSVKA